MYRQSISDKCINLHVALFYCLLIRELFTTNEPTIPNPNAELSSIGLHLLWIQFIIKHLHRLSFLRCLDTTCHGIQRRVKASDRDSDTLRPRDQYDQHFFIRLKFPSFCFLSEKIWGSVSSHWAVVVQCSCGQARACHCKVAMSFQNFSRNLNILPAVADM